MLIGIEIEFQVLSEEYNFSPSLFPKDWKLTEEDIDILELVSPPMVYPGEKVLTDLREICTVLRKLEDKSIIRFNSNCGLHVHFDMYNYSLDNIITFLTNWHINQSELEKYVDKCRIENQWCLRHDVEDPDLSNVVSISDITDILQRKNGKCYGLNLHSYKKFKTMEIRLLESTSSFYKIVGWIDLLLEKVFNYDNNNFTS